jgi:hypothetical protein
MGSGPLDLGSVEFFYLKDELWEIRSFNKIRNINKIYRVSGSLMVGYRDGQDESVVISVSPVPTSRLVGAHRLAHARPALSAHCRRAALHYVNAP